MSVRFAVLLILAISLAGLVGTLVRQLSPGAMDDPAMRARELGEMAAALDPVRPFGLPVGPALYAVFDALGLFRVFSAPWFVLLLAVLVLAIVCCTIDRTPRLWRTVRELNVAQPAPFFDPILPNRAALGAGSLTPDAIAAIVRGRRYTVRRAGDAGGAAAWVHGDRFRYMKMTTLLTHLGLILFLAGGAVTAAAGFETVVFVGVGQTAPVRAVGTPGNLIVKVNDFAAPRRANGTFADFRTDLSVYRDGTEVARKTIRVNDPLDVAGYRFHQTTFGPAAALTIRDAAGGLLWTGPILLAGELLGRPQGFLTIPGTAIGLLVLIDRTADGVTRLVLQGVGADPGGDGTQTLFQAALPPGGESDPGRTAGVAIRWDGTEAWTGMVVRNDPGIGLIWIAFLFLISGLVLTFYFPRRQVWARVADGRIALALAGDRHSDLGRELERLRSALLAAGATPLPEPPDGPPGTPATAAAGASGAPA